MRGYHFSNSRWMSMTMVPRPRVRRVGVLVWPDAQTVEALLWSGSTPLRDVQLLPAAAAPWNHACAQSVREGARQSAPGVWVFPGGLCVDAESRAPFDQRTEKGNAFDGVADAQAAGVPETAEDQTGSAESTRETCVSRIHRGIVAILAAAVLRFQRI